MQTHDSEVPGAKKSLGVGASKPASKLTESIMALAGFKGKEAELTKIAHSTVAAAAAVSSPIVGEGPIASRTRRSLEGSKKSLGSARKGAPTSGKDARKSEEKKRVHNAGASTTPSKSVTKKPRTEEKRPVASKEAKTPSFERFGGARGRRTGVLSTPNGRSSSAPAPRSGRKMVKCFPAHGLSRGLLGCGSGMHVLTSFLGLFWLSLLVCRPIPRRRPPSCSRRRAQKPVRAFAARVPHLCVRRLHRLHRVSRCPPARTSPRRCARGSVVWTARCLQARWVMSLLAVSAPAACTLSVGLLSEVGSVSWGYSVA